jgi:hypothetical protein
MRVDEDFEAVVYTELHEALDILYIGVVVNAGAFMLQCLPHDRQSQNIETQIPQLRKMRGCTC